jgi:TPR repeat protein
MRLRRAGCLRFAALLMSAALLLQPAAAEDRVAREAVEALEAYAAYKMAQFPEAYRRFLVLAQKNNIQGMLNVANMLQAGQGVARDEAAALDWYRRAAERGSAIGMFYTGQAYRHGRGAAVDPQQARSWLRRAAEAGSDEARLELARLSQRATAEAEAQETVGHAARDADGAVADAPVGASERELIAAAWGAIDRAAQNRNAPGAAHYLAHDAEVRVRLPGAMDWVRMGRRQWRDFWQYSFDRTTDYSMRRGALDYRPRGELIEVESIIEESLVTASGSEELRLEESALVRIDGNRVVIERLSIAIERR